jgi:hypothetical protein
LQLNSEKESTKKSEIGDPRLQAMISCFDSLYVI